MFDCAIIGTGAAGVSAALTLKSLNKNFIWFGSDKLSSKIRNAEMIRNYPGLSCVSGKELCDAFCRQIIESEITITPKTVTGVYDMGDYYGILCGNDSFDAKSVILATGVESVKPVDGELDFVGRGVSYCATCDGFLYKGKTIAIICTSAEYEHEVEYLASIAEKIYLVPIYKNYRSDYKNTEVVCGMPLKIIGNKKAEKLVFKDREIELDGIFMLKSAVAPSVLVSGLQAENGHVTVNRLCETNLSGCFAAGDCTGRPYQYAKAVGEGNVAAHSVIKYLSGKE